MGRVWLLAGTAFLVSGCGLPIGVQMASMAIQGMSLMATEKTLTDHGISLVAQRDCALWRGLGGDPVCVDTETLDGPIAVAAAEPDAVGAAGADGPVEHVASWAPALAPRKPVPEAPAPGRFAVDVAALDGVTPAAGGARFAVLKDDMASDPVAHPVAVPVEAASPLPSDPADDLYFIIGSFRTTERAWRLVDSRRDLSPTVVRAEAKGHTVYRVAVGPFTADDRAAQRRRLTASGIGDAWVLPYDADAWTVVTREPAAARLEVAQLIR